MDVKTIIDEIKEKTPSSIMVVIKTRRTEIYTSHRSAWCVDDCMLRGEAKKDPIKYIDFWCEFLDAKIDASLYDVEEKKLESFKDVDEIIELCKKDCGYSITNVVITDHFEGERFHEHFIIILSK